MDVRFLYLHPRSTAEYTCTVHRGLPLCWNHQHVAVNIHFQTLISHTRYSYTFNNTETNTKSCNFRPPQKDFWQNFCVKKLERRLRGEATYPGLIRQQCRHILIADGRHHFDVLVITLHPFLVFRDIFGIQQFTWWRINSKSMFTHWTTIHESLSNHRKTRIHNVGFINVKHKIWIFNDVHPKPQWKTAMIKDRTNVRLVLREMDTVLPTSVQLIKTKEGNANMKF